MYSVTTEGGQTLPWMILVHGMSQDHHYFDQQVAYFGRTHRLLAVDLPGHGLASKVEGPFGHVEMARHVASEIGRAGVHGAVYWGTHTGATIAPLVNRSCPGVLTSFILEGPAVPGENPAVVVDLLGRAARTVRNIGVEAAIEAWWSESCWFDAMRRNPDQFRAAEHLEMIRDFSGAPWLSDAPAIPVPDAKALLREMNMPTLVYNGADDHADFHAAADRITSFISHAVRATVQDTGGFPTWERPMDANALVAGFLRDADG